MLNLTAALVAALVGFLPHLMLGDRLAPFTDFLIGTVFAGATYVFVFWLLKKARGDI